MKRKTLINLDEGELFFAYVDTEDGKDLRSYIKGKANVTDLNYFHCECSTGDKWQAKNFPLYHTVWA